MKKIKWWWLKRKYKVIELQKVKVRYEDYWDKSKPIKITIYKHYSELTI